MVSIDDLKCIATLIAILLCISGICFQGLNDLPFSHILLVTKEIPRFILVKILVFKIKDSKLSK